MAAPPTKASPMAPSTSRRLSAASSDLGVLQNCTGAKAPEGVTTAKRIAAEKVSFTMVETLFNFVCSGQWMMTV
jgi:hypothetical protein